jgi:hypothetical protein
MLQSIISYLGDSGISCKAPSGFLDCQLRWSVRNANDSPPAPYQSAEHINNIHHIIYLRYIQDDEWQMPCIQIRLACVLQLLNTINRYVSIIESITLQMEYKGENKWNTIWQSELPACSIQRIVKPNHQVLGTKTHRLIQPEEQDPEMLRNIVKWTATRKKGNGIVIYDHE